VRTLELEKVVVQISEASGQIKGIRRREKRRMEGMG